MKSFMFKTIFTSTQAADSYGTILPKIMYFFILQSDKMFTVLIIAKSVSFLTRTPCFFQKIPLND